ncbi:MAG: class I SAM-dependent methyltransferase [Rhodospirillaceae bacterium]|jgi:ubiquinone/menaquinone biosynthesis C-methylase UbiE|nr:class I SAM-dependent methyltransferase [Rhodospirillaceae bacterium]MBT4688777.1 class I SAM-dependent methyltransferase [Rhodospirillaceae bacterium]MBT5083397.1 class I SAM-dependent methyltransferase [Rhodospirillaceae bacterium]MBT5525553.1 class I SAM-dependent methyltransferase [Rhodospirillaceae bacterium]MBT5880595.1 class I SAM-dependent methyltransferase [Rhodospirillaceae bacterium]
MTNDSYHAKEKYVGNVAADYDDQRVEKPHWGREQAVVAQFVANLASGTTVMDVPFGTGRYVDGYLERGLKVIGADISADMIAAAADRMGGATFEQLDVRVADAEHLPFPDGAADAVVSTRFIKWLPNLAVVENVIGQFVRICPMGRMLIQVKVTADGGAEARGVVALIKRLLWLLRDGLRTVLSAVAGREGKKTRRYSDGDMRAIFARHGLNIIDVFDDEDESRAIRYYILESADGKP